MRRIRSMGLVLALLIAASLTAYAQDSGKPAKKAIKLTKPWSELTSLTDEQRAQIHEIHQKALAEIKAIREKEEADILALLTPQQKEELAALEAREKAAAKERRAAKKQDEQTEKPE
ncbi:hypothetical protein [Fontivita pretiosa]|uniref:hypothetical protein n=1 Tax=Fontivita pretiosa TaxID=2989684 RepID=UPI003D176AAA